MLRMSCQFFSSLGCALDCDTRARAHKSALTMCTDSIQIQRNLLFLKMCASKDATVVSMLRRSNIWEAYEILFIQSFV